MTIKLQPNKKLFKSRKNLEAKTIIGLLPGVKNGLKSEESLSIFTNLK